MSDKNLASQSAILAQIQEELASEIETLGASLCESPGIVADHVADLQAIDLIAQKQRNLAKVIEAGLSQSSVDAVNIDCFRERLNSALSA